MTTLRIRDLHTITVKILPDKKRVQFRFEAADAGAHDSIEFELASIMALAFANETVKLLSPATIASKLSRAASRARPKRRAMK
jgi:hypothetical protein